jgi:hypothetical protein
MMTGVDAAGLALGIFPLIVEGLKAYGHGVSTINDCRRYEGVLGRLIRDLNGLQTVFNNTCIFFLQDMIAPEEVTALLADPGGPLWRAPDFEKSLEERMSAETMKAIMETVQDIGNILQELGKKFRLQKDQEVSIYVPWSCTFPAA